ncbi:unnamed protein product, partial [Nesidiocoris tenuis]
MFLYLQHFKPVRSCGEDSRLPDEGGHCFLRNVGKGVKLSSFAPLAFLSAANPRSHSATTSAGACHPTPSSTPPPPLHPTTTTPARWCSYCSSPAGRVSAAGAKRRGVKRIYRSLGGEDFSLFPNKSQTRERSFGPSPTRT